MLALLAPQGLRGLLALRTQGFFFLMTTLAFGQMLFFLFTSLTVYGGDDGMAILERSRMVVRDCWRALPNGADGGKLALTSWPCGSSVRPTGVVPGRGPQRR